MRVLHIDEGLQHRGGQRQVALLLDDPDAALLSSPTGPLWGRTTRRYPFGLRGLFRAIRDFRPDLIAAHTSRAHDLALLQPLPVVVHRRVDFRRRSLKYRAVRGFVAVSRAVRDVLVEGGVHRHRVRVVPDALIPRGRAKAMPGAPRRLVLAAGAPVAHKDHPTVIRAAAIAGLPLWIAGPDRCEPPAVALGWRHDLSDLLAVAEVFAHSSREEGFGSVLLEARAAGCGIVATRAGGAPEAAGPQAILVPPRDPVALAEALSAARRGPPEALPEHQPRVIRSRTREAYHHLLAV